MHSTIQQIFKGDYDGYFLIAGPCVVENAEVCDEVAERMLEMSQKLELPYIFKASFTKANRTKHSSFTGIERNEAFSILKGVASKHEVAITTDVHDTSDVREVKDFIDLIQIPAFLSRQTALLEAAGATGRAVNIKKGQFMSGEAMHFAAEKVRSTGNQNVMLTERGTFMGYQDLVVDGRNIAHMAQSALTVMDVTHATQRPNQTVGVSGGNPADVALMGRIGLCSGARGIFMEVHPKPKEALSDGATMIALDNAYELLARWKELAITLNRING